VVPPWTFPPGKCQRPSFSSERSKSDLSINNKQLTSAGPHLSPNLSFLRAEAICPFGSCPQPLCAVFTQRNHGDLPLPFCV